MALSDADVQKQIKHMMAFIEQEANEKAEEIDVKVSKHLKRIQNCKICNYFILNLGILVILIFSLSFFSQSSNLLNQARLKVLRDREEHIKDVLEEARRRLGQVTNDKHRYRGILEGLITQALFQLLETNVIIKCREQDVNLVKEVLPQCQENFKAATSKDVKVTISTDSFLASSVSGGVEVFAQQGKIKVINTLDKRLELISQQMLPQQREILFGKNVNRRFLN
ncbi:V-type proton ATPase subunit E [Octopus bimaculoides]|nr:V-type proton ATPase subunit E [Octopus bimaculoides]